MNRLTRSYSNMCKSTRTTRSAPVSSLDYNELPMVPLLPRASRGDDANYKMPIDLKPRKKPYLGDENRFSDAAAAVSQPVMELSMISKKLDDNEYCFKTPSHRSSLPHRIESSKTTPTLPSLDLDMIPVPRINLNPIKRKMPAEVAALASDFL